MELDSNASFVYRILVDDEAIASENKTFVHVLESVKSTEAGNYTCEVSLAAAPDIKRGSDGEMLSGKCTFLILFYIPYCQASV